jgi:hypothetical protein
MTRIAALIAFLLVVPASAAADTRDRDAPWRLRAISKDQQTLRVTYEGGGCYGDDGRPVVDTGTPGQVSIRILQSEPTDPDAVCPAYFAFLHVDVPLGEKLAGRRVVGGPELTEYERVPKVPRVVGLRRADAVHALEGQGFKTRTEGRRHGVVRKQSPKPGTRKKLLRDLAITLTVR